MQIHQHVQPLGALHAHDTLHTGLLGRRFPQRPGTVLDAAHGPGVVHNALVLLRRVAVPHAVGLPQGHTVAAGLGHRRAPVAVPLHQLRLGLAGLVHGVLQPVQLRVFVPQLTVAVGRPVQHLARQRLGQRLGLCHVRAVRFQVVHQHPGLVGQLCPVGPAGVGFRPPRRQPVQAVLAHLHTPRHPKELAQGVHGRRRVRNIPARLPLVVLLCLPAGLLRQLEAHIRHLVQQLRARGIIPSFVQLHRHTLILQLPHKAFAGIVRQNSRPYLVKAHRPLGLCFKVSCRNLRRIIVQLQNSLCCIFSNNVPIFCKGLSNGCGRPLPLCSFHQNFAQDFHFFKAVVCVRRRFSPQPLQNIINLCIHFFQLGIMFCICYLPQSALVCPNLIQCFIFCRCRAHQCFRRYAPRAFSPGVLLAHGFHQIFQRIGVVQLSKTTPVAIPG